MSYCFSFWVVKENSAYTKWLRTVKIADKCGRSDFKKVFG